MNNKRIFDEVETIQTFLHGLCQKGPAYVSAYMASLCLTMRKIDSGRGKDMTKGFVAASGATGKTFVRLQREIESVFGSNDEEGDKAPFGTDAELLREMKQFTTMTIAHAKKEDMLPLKRKGEQLLEVLEEMA